MEDLIKWLSENVVLCSVVGVVGAIILGSSTNKIQNFGLGFSQFIRRRFGKKFEKAVENAVEALDRGLKSDNDKE